jgi:hypothetical protein
MIDRLTLAYMRPEIEGLISAWGYAATVEALGASLREYAMVNPEESGTYAMVKAADLCEKAGATLAGAGI